MKLFAAVAAALLMAVLTHPATASAASDTDTTSIDVDPANQIQMQIGADCPAAQNRCSFTTTANLLTPEGPTGFPGDTWARQTITLRSSDRLVWWEASYSAPAGMPRNDKGTNHDNVLSKLFKSTNSIEISVTTFGGGPIERFRIDGDAAPIDWSTGQPRTQADLIACSQIQVVYGGVNLTTPTACAQTTFS
jgi:hypothetical protein